MMRAIGLGAVLVLVCAVLWGASAANWFSCHLPTCCGGAVAAPNLQDMMITEAGLGFSIFRREDPDHRGRAPISGARGRTLGTITCKRDGSEIE
jgi:hypothetical protein